MTAFLLNVERRLSIHFARSMFDLSIVMSTDEATPRLEGEFNVIALKPNTESTVNVCQRGKWVIVRVRRVAKTIDARET